MGETGITVIKRKGDVGILLINNPPENYLQHPEFIGLDKLRTFVGTGIKALIISGTGRHFSAGADLKLMRQQIEKINVFQNDLEKGNELLNFIDDLNIPVFAAISGVCFGAGLEIALASDIRVSEKNALFSFPEVNQELMPGMGGIRRMVNLIGSAGAIELVTKGDMIDAEKARQLKIIDRLFPGKVAFDQALDLAEKMTKNRPLQVINSIMESIRFAKTHSREESVKHDAKLFGKLALKAFHHNKV